MDKRRDWGEPVVKVKLYVEGGGDSKSQKSSLRQGLRQYLEEAGLRGKMPGIVACGGRDAAYNRFGLTHFNTDTVAILVVDSEGPVTANQPWQHLKNRDGWDRPSRAQDDQCHLMVQAMESWLVSDREALAGYYGKGFRSNSIPQWPDIEQVPKHDVDVALKRATRATGKGSYHKGRHSSEILGRLNPNNVTAASPYARRFLDTLKALVASR